MKDLLIESEHSQKSSAFQNPIEKSILFIFLILLLVLIAISFVQITTTQTVTESIIHTAVLIGSICFFIGGITSYKNKNFFGFLLGAMLFVIFVLLAILR